MTVSTLRSYSIKDLGQLAKRRGVNGWQTMRKDQLVRALMRVAKPKSVAKPAKKLNGRATRAVATKRPSNGSLRPQARLRPANAQRLAKKARIAHKIEQAKL